MRHGIPAILAAFFCVLFLTALSATAQVVVYAVPTLTVSTGYSNLETQRAASNNLFYDHSGAYVDADVAWTIGLPVPLEVGFGLTGSGNWDRQSIANNNNNDNFYYSDNHIYSDIGLFEIEPRIAMRFGRSTGFFIQPRAGAGLLVDSYAIDQALTDSNGNTYIHTDYHTGAAFEIRPAIQAGYCFGFVSAGIEGSYMWSWGDFGGLGHHAEEYRVGVFVKFSF